MASFCKMSSAAVTGKNTGKNGELSLKRRRHHHFMQYSYGLLAILLGKINRERFRRNRETMIK